MRDLKERLLDILQAIAAVERYGDRDRTAFEQDEMLQVWFLRHLQIIGEAARGLPEEVRNLAPEIPLAKIIGMRNILVHGYLCYFEHWLARFHEQQRNKWATVGAGLVPALNYCYALSVSSPKHPSIMSKSPSL